MSLEKIKKFAIYTLGCKVNQEEGAALAALFQSVDYQKVDFSERADIYIINTCTVTHVADRKCRAMIRRAVKKNPQALVVAAGCYAQVAPEALAKIEGLDLIVGVNERAELLSLIKERMLSQTSTPEQFVGDLSEVRQFVEIGDSVDGQMRTRASIKIEDGCDQFCNYCLVPYARGSVRSLPVEKVVKKARELLDSGRKELVLSGIHIGAYGQDLPGVDLEQLLRELLLLHGEWRLRLGSLEPQHFSVSLLKLVMSEPKICPHLHIPLQSGCDKTLSSMGRSYTTRQYADLLIELRTFDPLVAITSDVIVGYPGETEDDFKETLAFCHKMAFADLHIFPYSQREGTPAAASPLQVDEVIKKKRVEELTDLAAKMRMDYGEGFVGRTVQFLPEQQVEMDGELWWQGHSENYLLVHLPLAEGVRGEMVPVIIQRAGKKSFFCSRKI